MLYLSAIHHVSIKYSVLYALQWRSFFFVSHVWFHRIKNKKKIKILLIFKFLSSYVIKRNK